MKSFRLLVEGTDATGVFLVTCIVSAESVESARKILTHRAAATDWSISAWEEDECLGEAPADAAEIVVESGRAYFENTRT